MASEPPTHAPERCWRLIRGDDLETLSSLPTAGFDGLFCDPPYGLADPRRLLVPYCGSDSEMLGALAAGWAEVVGIDSDPRWLQVTRRRLGSHLESCNRNQEELQGAAGSSA